MAQASVQKETAVSVVGMEDGVYHLKVGDTSVHMRKDSLQDSSTPNLYLHSLLERYHVFEGTENQHLRGVTGVAFKKLASRILGKIKAYEEKGVRLAKKVLIYVEKDEKGYTVGFGKKGEAYQIRLLKTTLRGLKFHELLHHRMGEISGFLRDPRYVLLKDRESDGFSELSRRVRKAVEDYKPKKLFLKRGGREYVVSGGQEFPLEVVPKKRGSKPDKNIEELCALTDKEIALLKQGKLSEVFSFWKIRQVTFREDLEVGKLQAVYNWLVENGVIKPIKLRGKSTKLVIDGQYGSQTIKAIKHLQRQINLLARKDPSFREDVVDTNQNLKHPHAGAKFKQKWSKGHVLVGGRRQYVQLDGKAGQQTLLLADLLIEESPAYDPESADEFFEAQEPQPVVKPPIKKPRVTTIDLGKNAGYPTRLEITEGSDTYFLTIGGFRRSFTGPINTRNELVTALLRGHIDLPSNLRVQVRLVDRIFGEIQKAK